MTILATDLLTTMAPKGYTGSQGTQGITGTTGPGTSINATDDTSTTALYPVMVGAAGSAQTPKASTTKFSFNAATGAISDADGDVRNLPSLAKSAAYVPVSSDNGGMINITTGGVTINTSVFVAGNNITVYNNSGSSQTITQGTGVTMYLAGTATTGNRTLSQRGICTIVCVVDSTTFVISGSGLS